MNERVRDLTIFLLIIVLVAGAVLLSIFIPRKIEVTDGVEEIHEYSEWQLKSLENYESDRVYFRICADCGEEETKTIPNTKLNSNETIVPLRFSFNSENFEGVDLLNSPIRIIVSTPEGSVVQQIVIDDIDDLNDDYYLRLEKGNYNYSILSDEIAFNSVEGDLDATSYNLENSIDLKVIDEITQYGLRFVISTDNYTCGSFRLYGAIDVVNVLSEKLEDENYDVILKFFDNSGNLIDTLNHTHWGGSCGDEWAISDSFKNGLTYTIQMLYKSHNNDEVFVSDIDTFNFDSTKGYRFTYSCIENLNGGER